ncbi:hypothetical protein BTR23_23510 [Alkalihalophilus pseudofirmus]|nr:hypothetical protein BTR23_23510 [Alkalihalophilus pseudofirmus]
MGKIIGGKTGSGPRKTISGQTGSGHPKTIGGQQGTNYQRTNKTSGDCFVATAAYGTPLAEEINILRNYRDTVLRYSKTGKKFIAFYYTYGPYLASFINKNPLFKKPIRGLIQVVIRQLKK